LLLDGLQFFSFFLEDAGNAGNWPARLSVATLFLVSAWETFNAIRTVAPLVLPRCVGFVTHPLPI
jgi:hypothetical protein